MDLSGEIPVPKLESFESREKFNEWKQKTSSFTNRNNLNYQFKKNKYGVVASKKELGEFERARKREQRLADRINAEARDKPFHAGGKEQATVGQREWMLGKTTPTEVVRKPDFNFDVFPSRKRFETGYENTLERGSVKHYDKRKEKMKENFIQLLGDTFNSDADDLVKEIESLDAETFYDLFLMHEEFQFDYYYPKELEGESQEMHIGLMLSIVDSAKRNGSDDLPLKGLFEG